MTKENKRPDNDVLPDNDCLTEQEMKLLDTFRLLDDAGKEELFNSIKTEE